MNVAIKYFIQEFCGIINLSEKTRESERTVFLFFWRIVEIKVLLYHPKNQERNPFFFV